MHPIDNYELSNPTRKQACQLNYLILSRMSLPKEFTLCMQFQKNHKE